MLLISGFASTNDIDRTGEVVSSLVWQNAKALRNYTPNPILLFNHKSDFPIGRVTRVGAIEGRGLWVEAQVEPTPQAEQLVYPLIETGVICAFSIGFKGWKSVYNSKLDATIITDLELYELSVVPLPANASCIFKLDSEPKRLARTYEQVKALGTGCI